MRGFSILLLLHFLLVTLAPGWIVADFMLERTRIEKELCVQRMVPDDLRSCHGECQLSKRLHQADQRAENLPNVLRTLRIGEMLPVGPLQLKAVPTGGPAGTWAVLRQMPLEGHAWTQAPVPWC